MDGGSATANRAAAEAVAVLRDAFRSRNDKTLYLKADAGLAYGAVIETMDMVRRAGIERLGMVTEPVRER